MSYNREEHFKRQLQKLSFDFNDLTVLDVGCGGGIHAYLISKSARYVIGMDVDPNNEDVDSNSTWHGLEARSKNLKFEIGDITRIPFKDNTFDVAFSKDVFHHAPIAGHQLAISELKRVVKPKAIIIIMESNRYNPIMFIHMTKMLGHEHLRKSYFRSLIMSNFSKVEFKYFEDHYYPVKTKIGKMLLHSIDKIFEITPGLNRFLSYNVAIARNDKPINGGLNRQ